MIDTIVLKIERLDLHADLLNSLRLRGENTMKGLSMHPDNIIAAQTKLSRQQVAMNVIFNEQNGKAIQLWEFKKIPSYHYGIQVYVDYVNDCIRINLSLPKYMYGHNLKHLIDKSGAARTLSGCYMDVYKEFKRSVNCLFSDIGCYPDWELVEVERMDFCYNYHARNYEQARYLLSQMRSIRPKGTRIETASFSDYQSTLFFKTKNHTSKVYLKGKEFQRNDAKKLRKNSAFDTNS